MSLRVGKRAATLTGVAAALVVLCVASFWWFHRTDDTPYTVAAEPKVSVTYQGESPSKEMRTFLTVFVQRLADGDVKGIDALADGYPDGAAASQESSDFLRPLAPAAGGGPVMAHAGPVSDSRSFLQRIEAPQGGTAEAELTLSNGKHVHIQLARERGVWWGYALAPAD
ncbi:MULTISPECIES: hypothetical protein [Streptomyces]|jgi:hypothetical protein|uniref:hypothetical protein n=1 Tax=unclassified Streptomyces TaxID=2593676 RepID=UPI000883A496|nr:MULTISPECIES: hypothetical protein [unclassified Streptomyces]MDX2730685.1 hypothetical protein [Streptomyces sp. PA03-2a]MDX3765288.1 hypothetical protein [Streptomyces sp. AK08-01B]MDX3814867.1 hypothetical protein [Streptomyces sp. AK08-01A]SCY92401.1 hypothetical protein SAMN02745898_10574 [Streptomyces sp. 136MFCol5.1]SFS95476.1 hypothetical protein SAMN04487982_10573 [Streptomyces sp. ok210]